MTKVYVAGHQGMVGSALVRCLANDEDIELITATKKELDLLDAKAVKSFLGDRRPDVVYLAAARVGGILANDTKPADFLYENLTIQNNVIHSSFSSGIERLLFLGSSCIYPRITSQPIREEQLLDGQLEGTNEGYAIAKIAGIKLCESLNRQHGTDYRSVMPTNLYGPGDNFHEENSHVIPALLMRFHEARLNGLDSVHVWGSGRPKREFLHVDDLAAACVHVMNIDNRDYSRVTDTRCSHINIGTGIDCSIKELVEELCKVTGYSGEVIYDTTKPDGTPRKLLDISRIRSLGWKPSVSLSRGLTDTYTWYLANYGKTRSH